MKAVIYKITNPLGFVYVGSTLNTTNRFRRYKNLTCKSQRKLYDSLLIHGYDNHVIEIICTSDISERYYLECYYGFINNCLDYNGLNCSLPFLGMCKSSKDLIGKAHKGKKISEIQKNNMIFNLKEYYKNNGNPMKGKTPWNKNKTFLSGNKNPMYGIKRTDEWKENHSKLMKLKNKSGEHHFKSKIILDIYTGVFYTNVKEVSDLFNISYSTLKQRIRKNKDYRYIYA